MIRGREQYESACSELRILSEKDRSVGLGGADRIRFEALADAVSRYEEDPVIFHRQRYNDDTTGHEQSAR